MAAKIGIFGETTDVTQTTTTLYTVPADKAARVRVMWVVEGGTAQWECGIMMGPGDEILLHNGASADEDSWTGSERQNTPDPTGSVNMAGSFGIMAGGSDLVDLNNSNHNAEWIVAPLSIDYFLSTADVVKFILTGSNGTDGYINVGGVEDDA